MEAPHLGVSSGGVEVEGTVLVRASLTGNGSSGGVEVEGKGWKWEGFAKFARPAA